MVKAVKRTPEWLAFIGRIHGGRLVEAGATSPGSLWAMFSADDAINDAHQLMDSPTSPRLARDRGEPFDSSSQATDDTGKEVAASPSEYPEATSLHDDDEEAVIIID